MRDDAFRVGHVALGIAEALEVLARQCGTKGPLDVAKHLDFLG